MKKIAFHSYFGGKNQMGKTFISPYTPKNIKTFVEPFSGSFGIYFQTDFEDDVKVIYNDFNKDQANLFYCSKDYNKMLEKINYHLTDTKGVLYCPKDIDQKEFYKELYYSTKKSDFSTLEFDLGNYDRACMYVFLLTSAFNSCHYMAAGFSGFNKDRMKLMTFINKLNNEYIRYKLDRITTIENLDFEVLINKYDSPETYFYLDPPYAQDEGIKDKGNKRLEWYGVESESSFGPSSHKRLADLLKTVKGKWSMSYYDFPELSEWFPKDKYKWVSKDFFRSSASFSDSKDTKGTEILIMNYDMSEEEHQENYNHYNSDTSRKTTTKLTTTKKSYKNKPSDELINNVIEQIKEDINFEDYTGIEELLSFCPIKNLESYLPEEEKIEELEKISNLGPDNFGGEDYPSDPEGLLEASGLKEIFKEEIKEQESDDFWG